MTTTTDIVVKTCEDCPFYERTAISVIADMMAKDARKTGACKANARAGLGFPFGRVHIAEPTKNPPATCPLRNGGTRITLAGDV